MTERILDLQMGPARVVVIKGATSWGTRETGRLELPTNEGMRAFRIAYDEREAPYAANTDGTERNDVLLSLTDEDELCGCAWAEVTDNTDLLGVGVDLASPADFGIRPGTERFIELIFSERERELASELDPTRPHLAYATLFGAKEAAFKATAHPLRAWYATHSTPLEYEVRDFGMETLGEERGELRRKAAQRALDRMGIERIRILHTTCEGMALVVALAYGVPLR